jgi:hypothetical protein
MKVAEILSWNNEPTKRNRSDPQLDFPPTQFSDDLTKLANAFTKDGRVKHLWNLDGSGEQPAGPAPPDAEAELIRSGTLEPTTPHWQAEPVEEESPLGQQRLVRFYQCRGVSGD